MTRRWWIVWRGTTATVVQARTAWDARHLAGDALNMPYRDRWTSGRGSWREYEVEALAELRVERGTRHDAERFASALRQARRLSAAARVGA